MCRPPGIPARARLRTALRSEPAPFSAVFCQFDKLEAYPTRYCRVLLANSEKKGGDPNLCLERTKFVKNVDLDQVCRLFGRRE